MKKLPLVLLTFALLQQAAIAADPPPPVDIPIDISMLNPPQLGGAYHSASQRFSSACVRNPGGTIEVNQQGSLAAEIESSTEDALSSLGLQTSGRYSTGLTKTSASAEFAKSTIQSAFTVNLIYKFVSSYSEQFNESGDNSVTIKDAFKSLLNNQRGFYQTCGDEYVSAITRTAQILVNLSIQFASKEEAQSFGAQFKYDSPHVGIHAALESATKNVSKKTKMTFNSIQIGGTAGKSGKAICPSDILGNAGRDSSCSDSMVQCGFGSFSQCINLFEKIISYSAGDFSDQIVDKTNGHPQNYAVAAVHTEPYVYAGADFPQVPDASQERSFQNELAILNGHFERYFKQWVLASRILSNEVPRLSDRQRGKMNAVQLQLHDLVMGLVNRIDDCYKSGYAACEKNSGAELNTFLDQQLASLKTTFGSDLDDSVVGKLDADGVEASIMKLSAPETFAQFCDIADDLHPSYKRTVDTLKAVIDAQVKKANGELPEDLTHGDLCVNYGLRLNRLTELDLSAPVDGKQLSIGSLAPLTALPSLTRLNLADRGITDISLLQNMRNLESLNLDGNAIDDVCALSSLPRLRTLSIQNQQGQLESIACLKSSPKLTSLDVRGNPGSFTCPLSDPRGCKLLDFTKSLTISKRASQCEFRVGAQATTMYGAQVLVSGGVVPADGYHSINSLSIYDQNGCQAAPSTLQVARANHTATALLDSRILIAGGDTDTLEIVTPVLGFKSQLLPVRMDSARSFHTATLLRDGRVLIVGGYRSMIGFSRAGAVPSRTYQIVNPLTGKIDLTGTLVFPRAEHTATLLANGSVLILGGNLGDRSLASAEVIDPAQTSSHLLGDMLEPRFGQSASTLPDGRILIAGGFSYKAYKDKDGNTVMTPAGLSSVEIYDPSTQRSEPVQDHLAVGRGMMATQALPDGRILLVGGSIAGKLYDFHAGRMPSSAPNYEDFLGASSVIEIYDPQTEGLYRTNDLSLGRVQAGFAMLKPSVYLIIGGTGSNASPLSSELVIYRGL
ncbi:MAG: leucine-rich repeat domain-containing protein [Bdellovibrionia bacterium]